jgi:hypothetical protein
MPYELISVLMNAQAVSISVATLDDETYSLNFEATSGTKIFLVSLGKPYLGSDEWMWGSAKEIDLFSTGEGFTSFEIVKTHIETEVVTGRDIRDYSGPSLISISLIGKDNVLNIRASTDSFEVPCVIATCIKC